MSWRSTSGSRSRTSSTRRTCCARFTTQTEGAGRICQPRSLALSGDDTDGDDRRGAAALAGGRPREPDDQGAGDDGRACRRSAQLIGEGINVNITLLFSQQVYEEVVEAYLAGLEASDRARRRSRARSQASPASSSAASTSRWTSSSTNESQPANEADATRDASRRSRQGRDRQRQACLSTLQAAVRRRALGEAAGQGRASAAAALGKHRHEEQGLQRRALRRGADRSRYGQHHAAGDDGCVPRSRQGARRASRRISTKPADAWPRWIGPAFRSTR